MGIWSPNSGMKFETEPLSQNWRVVGSIDGYHARSIFGIDWSRDGKIVTACGDNGIRIFMKSHSDMNSISNNHHICWELVTSIPYAHDGEVNSVRWSPEDPQILASAG